MESDEDPLLVKFVVSSLEFEKLKYFESKCHQLTSELDKLKLKNSEQVGGGQYIIESNSTDSLKTPTIKEVNDCEKDLINYSVLLKKNDDNDSYDESELLQLVPVKDQRNAKFLLQKIDDRGSEITWNSSGVVFIDKTSIPESNMFTIYPYLFQERMPKREIPGLKEVVNKLKFMGLSHLISLQSSQSSSLNKEGIDFLRGAGIATDNVGNSELEVGQVGTEEGAAKIASASTNILKMDETTDWWFINE